MIDIVIARYKEDVSWVSKLPPETRAIIYNKGEPITWSHYANGPDEILISQLPNVGREAHSYLTHMIAHYSLPNRTVFCQGNPFDHCPDFLEKISLLALSDHLLQDWISFGHFCECDWIGMPQHMLPIAKTYEDILQKPAPNKFKFVVGAQFSIKMIHASIQTLVKAADMVSHDRGADLRGQDNNGCTWGAHILERLWSYLLIGAEPQ